MGHCDSSTHVSGYGGVCRPDGGVAETVAAARERNGESRFSQRIGKYVRSAGKWTLLLFIRIYQVFLSPFFGGACKFYPSCSRYGYEAIARHGARRGSVLALKRLLRCRPFTKGGFDPVPDVVEPEQRELQGLKPHFVPGVGVAPEAATYKDPSTKHDVTAVAAAERRKPFVETIQGRPVADGAHGKPFVETTQGKQEFAQ
jgi:putative membrane protein insertion efficiency factor